MGCICSRPSRTGTTAANPPAPLPAIIRPLSPTDSTLGTRVYHVEGRDATFVSRPIYELQTNGTVAPVDAVIYRDDANFGPGRQAE